MTPPYLDPATTGTLQSYMPLYPQPSHSIQSQQMGRKRQDSIFHSQHTLFGYTGLPGDRVEDERPDSSFHRSGLDRNPPFADLRASQPALPQKQNAFHFVVTTNPTKPKDKVKMRENRAHVMHDFLRKESRKTPGTRDIRAEGLGQADRHRRLTSGSQRTRKARQLAVPSNSFDPGILTPQSLFDGPGSSVAFGSESEGTMLALMSRPASQPPEVDHSLHVIPRSGPDEEERHSACPSASSGFVHFPGSCGCRWPDMDMSRGSGVPDLFSLVGFRVGPYHTWLQSTNTTINLEKLKYTCGMRLRSCAMAETWLPNLIRARHSYLSTICISTAHDEAMQMTAFGSESLRGPKKYVVYERMAVKAEVICMINKVLGDPKQRTSDATIIAVLNIVNSEMIGGDANALRWHQQGLHEMVLMRGGLDKLGVLGHLARTLTVTMLVNAVLQEEVANDTYLRYAQERAAPPPDDQMFPESPIYCGRQYATVSKILGASESLALLDLLRKVTWVYQAHEEPDFKALKYFHSEIMRFGSGSQASEPLRMVRTREAIRLTARLYADALVENVHFSRAPRNAAGRPARFVEIVGHLKHTDLDRVWGGLSGILFWIVLVVGAAANRSRVENASVSTDQGSGQEEEEARQWLAAVAVRCSIILGFEHGHAVLGSLRNVLDVQDRLERRQCRRKAMVGPERRGMPQNGFGDFAWDFLAEDK